MSYPRLFRLAPIWDSEDMTVFCPLCRLVRLSLPFPPQLQFEADEKP